MLVTPTKSARHPSRKTLSPLLDNVRSKITSTGDCILEVDVVGGSQVGCEDAQRVHEALVQMALHVSAPPPRRSTVYDHQHAWLEKQMLLEATRDCPPAKRRRTCVWL